MARQKQKKRMTITELEVLLNQDEETEIEIMPNGEIRAKRKGKKVKVPKVLTFKEDLGGEYAEFTCPNLKMIFTDSE